MANEIEGLEYEIGGNANEAEGTLERLISLVGSLKQTTTGLREFGRALKDALRAPTKAKATAESVDAAREAAEEAVEKATDKPIQAKIKLNADVELGESGNAESVYDNVSGGVGNGGLRGGGVQEPPPEPTPPDTGAWDRFLSVLGLVKNAAVTAGTSIAKAASKSELLRGALSGLKSIAAAPFRILGNAAKGVIGTLGRLLSTIKNIMIIRVIRNVITSVISGIKEGLDNLYQYSLLIGGSFSGSMNSLATSFQYLQNSIAAAASPLINVLAPAVEFVVDKFVDLLNIANQVISALMGSSTWTRAVRVPKSYASAADSAAESTNNANDAAKEYKKTLMGFDEINKLNEQPDSSGSGDGGGGGGGTDVDYSSMFTTETVSGLASDWADMIKDAWEKADFTEIGTIVGTKLKNALDGIDWPGIQERCERVAKSVATFLNGFIETEDLGTSVGNTVGEAIYTGLDLADTFAKTFHWDSLGKFVADGINGAVKTLSSKDINLGSTIASLINGAISGLSSFTNTVKWSKVGTFITDNVNKFFTTFDGKKAGAAAHDLISGLTEMLTTAIDSIDSDAIAEDIVGFLQELDPVDIVIKVGKVFISFGGKLFESLAKLWDSIGFGNVFGDTATDVEIQMNAKANLTDVEDNIPTKKKTIGEMIAGLFKKDTSGLDKTVSGMTADLSKKNEGFSKTTGAMTAKLSGKSETFSKTTGAMTAKLSTKSESFSKTSTGWTAKMTKWLTSFKSKTITGWTAKLTSWVSALKNTVLSFAAKITGTKKAAGGMYRNGRWSPIQAYASGGLPNQGQMFIAREAGPELVGSIGSGTAVVNNDQIVASVSAGVYKAVLAAMSNSNGGRQSDTINVYVGNDKLVASVIRGVNDITARTGSCPIHV